MAFSFEADPFQLSTLLLITAIGFQVVSLIKYLNSKGEQDDLNTIFEHIEKQSLSLKTYPIDTDNEYLNRLNHVLNKVLSSTSVLE